MPDIIENMNEKNWSGGAAWMWGHLMPTTEAALPVTDWGLTHSDITYDVVHVWDGRFFRLDDYLTRFEDSLQKCNFSIDQSREDIRRILHQIVSKSRLKHAYVSFVASRGQPAISGSRNPRDCINHFYAWCVPFVWVFTEEVVRRGAHIYVPDNVKRISTSSVDPTAKNYHWGDFTQGLITAKDLDYDNTVLLDALGFVTEGPGFNVFLVKDGSIRTPKNGVLEGITRRVTMELCEHQQLSVEQTDITLQELLDADELFATTTGGGIVPITKVNQHTFSNDAAGEITLALQETYWQWHSDESMSKTVAYD